MAEKKNFIIENYNGTDYDTLYPETNSGQVLLDSDARVTTGLASGSTLDDALQSVVKDGGAFQIGDALTTVRTNLGDKWLLCNGQQITQTDYPVLVGLLGGELFNWVSKGTSAIVNINNIVNKTTTAGDLFLAAFRMEESSGSVYYCSYSTDLLSWQSLKTNDSKFDIWCVNGTWIIYSDYAVIADRSKKASYYSGENMNFDNFTAINGITESIDGVAYWNGKYYLSSKYHDLSSDKYTYYFYIYSNLSNAPQQVKVDGGGSLHVLPEGVAVCLSMGMDVPNFLVTVVNQQEQITKYTVSVPIEIRSASIEYFNGYYYAILETYAISGNLYRMYRSSSLTGTYSPVTYNGTEIQAKYLTITDDYLITNTGYYIDKENNVYQQTNPIKATVPILVGKDNYYTMVNITAYQSTIAASTKLPKVSTASGLYTYIKAKS